MYQRITTHCTQHTQHTYNMQIALTAFTYHSRTTQSPLSIHQSPLTTHHSITTHYSSLTTHQSINHHSLVITQLPLKTQHSTLNTQHCLHQKLLKCRSGNQANRPLSAAYNSEQLVNKVTATLSQIFGNCSNSSVMTQQELRTSSVLAQY